MSVRDEMRVKIEELPEDLLQEVNDFINFLLLKRGDAGRGGELAEDMAMVESDFASYLANLEEYEERLARGEIQW